MSLQKGYRSPNPPREHSFKNLPSPPGHISNTEPTSSNPSLDSNTTPNPSPDSNGISTPSSKEYSWSNLDDLPYVNEVIGPNGIYEEKILETINPSARLIANINPSSEDDSLIKFTANIKGSNSTTNAITFIDTGSQECVMGPSIFAALTTDDYIEERKVNLTGPDGSDVAIWKRVTFRPHAGIQIGNNKPIPFTASILFKDSKHYDILIAMNTLRKLGPVNIVISDQATILKFYGL